MSFTRIVGGEPAAAASDPEATVRREIDIEAPRGAKQTSPVDVCRVGALQSPTAAKVQLAASVWRLEAVIGAGDAEVARVAERQRGVVARSQLIAAQLTAAQIKHRLKIGQLHVLHPGVYLVGRPRLEAGAAATAAVIHLEGRGVLSHRTAGGLWRMTEGQPRQIELSTLGSGSGSGVRSAGRLVIHRTSTLARADVRRCRNLPVTSPSRTLVDLASVLDMGELEAAYAIARRARLATPKEIAAAIHRAPRSRGISNLRELVRAEDPGRRRAGGPKAPQLTRSIYERKLLKLIHDARLPRPLANAQVEGMEVDFLWPEQKLVVEFDSVSFHSDRAAFERDRHRDQRLIAAGYRVIRVTARQLDNDSVAVVATIAMALVR